MGSTTSGKITKEEIRLLLHNHYEKGGVGVQRTLIVSKQPDDNTYCFFALKGSPPKGYAIWIPEKMMLNLYDHTGMRFKRIYLQYGISDLD